MGVRNFRYATEDNAVSGETAKGDGDVLIYQTSQATPPASIFQGTSIGSIKGPQETSNVVVAYGHRDVNATGANGTTYDVTFYGGSTSTEAPQLAAINGAVNQADGDGIEIGELSGYPYTSDVQAAGTEVNGASQVPIIVCINNSVVS